MTAPAVQVPTPSAAERGARVLPALARRAALSVARQPELVVPGVFFPLFFVALNTAAFGRAPMLPGFPEVDSMLDFLLATAVVQGVLFGAVSGGADLAADIESGFFDRLLTSPVPRLSLLVGRLGGSMMLGVVQATFFVLVLLAFGGEVKAGVAGFLVLVAMAVLTAVFVGGLSMSLALRTGSSEAVQGAFPLFFILMFTSSAFFPRELMTGWYGTLADWNPISHLIEGGRDLVISGFEWDAVARALGVPAAMAALTLALAVRSLYARLEAR